MLSIEKIQNIPAPHLFFTFSEKYLVHRYTYIQITIKFDSFWVYKTHVCMRVGRGSTPNLEDLTFESRPTRVNYPLRGFPKIFGNKNAIISENSPGKINPPPLPKFRLM